MTVFNKSKSTKVSSPANVSLQKYLYQQAEAYKGIFTSEHNQHKRYKQLFWNQSIRHIHIKRYRCAYTVCMVLAIQHLPNHKPRDSYTNMFIRDSVPFGDHTHCLKIVNVFDMMKKICYRRQSNNAEQPTHADACIPNIGVREKLRLMPENTLN